MLIKVRVYPNSKTEKVLKKEEDSFEVRVKEKAEGGLANKAVFKILCSYFKISPSKIRLVKGARQRNKIFEIK